MKNAICTAIGVVGGFIIQDGVVYLCIRDTGNPVYHNLGDLVGLYVEEA